MQVGPPAPLLYDENLPQLLERFKSYLWRFQDAPWTIQRLCELVLEPQKQYTKLHKLVRQTKAGATALETHKT